MDNLKVVTEAPSRKLVASGRINRYGQMMRDIFARDDASETLTLRYDADYERPMPIQRAECGE